MTQNSKEILEKQEKFQSYSPVLIFIILIFILEVFHIQKATSLVISVFVSLFIFGVMAARLPVKYGNRPEFKPLNLYIGLLSFMSVLIIGVAILHWFQLIHLVTRWIIFFIVLVIYLIILFRGVHTLYQLSQHAKKFEVITRRK